MKKRVAVLGATGSIGKNALDVISQEKDHFEIVLLSAYNNGKTLDDIGRQWPNAELVLSGAAGGKESLLAAIANTGADIVLNGISGAAGLEPSMAAIEAGCDLALANKETLVMAGPLVLARAGEKNVQLIPVDSEHSAVYHMIQAHGKDNLEEIVLTASGGPFRNYPAEAMEKINPQDALAHPTWNMGTKITIDSATMANKGLEVIEAVRLFGFPPDKIKVVIHPQSIVHSMIRMKDGVLYAQLSRPDMRHPIQAALHHSSNLLPLTSYLLTSFPYSPLTFDNPFALEFQPPDMERFPLLAFAYEAVKKGGLYPCAYNAANEAAVTAFLEGSIGFLDIGRITQYVLDKDWSTEPEDIALVMDADRHARTLVKEKLWK
ncbi:MAG: 1-deoxy-D-xylulose-5-phosphate reductoisomerase [Treponema sp.]|nr:1-deoxy-D-xylulose-5-phosphate reductoisomerase [Treponema sp.]